MKDGVMLINTSRGGLIDTPAVIAAVKDDRVEERERTSHSAGTG